MALLFIFAGCGSYAADPGVPQADTKVYTKTQGEEFKNEPLRFRNERLLREHYEKHGIDMGFKSAVLLPLP